jgi:O-antigen/teichoic acid export membrane protein
MSRISRLKAFLVPKLHRVAEFLAAQGITMAGNLLYGLLCVRLLPKAEYAKFALVFSALATLALLSDIGITNSIVPLVGQHTSDSQLIADYIASLRSLALRLFAIMAPATAIVFPLVLQRQHWSATTVAAMVATVLVSAWFARVSSAYGAVLILRRDRPRWYRAQMISSLGTLALLGIFWATHILSVWVAILTNVAGIIFVAQSYYFRSRKLLGVQGHASAEKRKAIVHLVLPNMVNTIFYALQGQIPLILVTIFGITVAAVADMGALSRLTQIFVIFAQMNPILVEPYFARLPRERLRPSYLTAVSAVVLFCTIVVAVGRFFPELFLWVLGPQYSKLHDEVLLILIGSSIRYVSGTMWVIHSSRRFVYWWNNLTIMSLTLLVQVAYLLHGNLGTVRSALMFNIVSAIASLSVNIACAFYGFKHGPRALAGATPEVPAEIIPEIPAETEGELHG